MNSDETRRRNDFVGKKKVCRKFVTNSDKNLRETDGKATIRFVGIYFIRNLSETIPTTVINGKTFPTKSLGNFRRQSFVGIFRRKYFIGIFRRNIFRRKRPTTNWSEISDRFPTKYVSSVFFIYFIFYKLYLIKYLFC